MKTNNDTKTSIIDQTIFPGLTIEAFAPPAVDNQRKEKIQLALKKFYGEEANYLYGTEKFKQQFIQLLKAYDLWGENNHCLVEQTLEILLTTDLFGKREESRFVGQSDYILQNLKGCLEEIGYALLIESSLSFEQKKQLYLDITEIITVCGPGIYGRLQIEVLLLSKASSLPAMLARYREMIVLEITSQLINKKNITAGNEIHVSFLVRHLLNKAGCTVQEETRLQDNFINQIKLSKEDEKDILDSFSNSYQIPNILNFCISELQEQCNILSEYDLLLFNVDSSIFQKQLENLLKRTSKERPAMIKNEKGEWWIIGLNTEGKWIKNELKETYLKALDIPWPELFEESTILKFVDIPDDLKKNITLHKYHVETFWNELSPYAKALGFQNLSDLFSLDEENEGINWHSVRANLIHFFVKQKIFSEEIVIPIVLNPLQENTTRTFFYCIHTPFDSFITTATNTIIEIEDDIEEKQRYFSSESTSFKDPLFFKQYSIKDFEQIFQQEKIESSFEKSLRLLLIIKGITLDYETFLTNLRLSEMLTLLPQTHHWDCLCFLEKNNSLFELVSSFFQVPSYLGTPVYCFTEKKQNPFSALENLLNSFPSELKITSNKFSSSAHLMLTKLLQPKTVLNWIDKSYFLSYQSQEIIQKDTLNLPDIFKLLESLDEETFFARFYPLLQYLQKIKKEKSEFLSELKKYTEKNWFLTALCMYMTTVSDFELNSFIDCVNYIREIDYNSKEWRIIFITTASLQPKWALDFLLSKCTKKIENWQKELLNTLSIEKSVFMLDYLEKLTVEELIICAKNSSNAVLTCLSKTTLSKKYHDRAFSLFSKVAVTLAENLSALETLCDLLKKTPDKLLPDKQPYNSWYLMTLIEVSKNDINSLFHFSISVSLEKRQSPWYSELLFVMIPLIFKNIPDEIRDSLQEITMGLIERIEPENRQTTWENILTNFSKIAPNNVLKFLISQTSKMRQEAAWFQKTLVTVQFHLEFNQKNTIILLELVRSRVESGESRQLWSPTLNMVAEKSYLFLLDYLEQGVKTGYLSINEEKTHIEMVYLALEAIILNNSFLVSKPLFYEKSKKINPQIIDLFNKLSFAKQTLIIKIIAKEDLSSCLYFIAQTNQNTQEMLTVVGSTIFLPSLSKENKLFNQQVLKKWYDESDISLNFIEKNPENQQYLEKQLAFLCSLNKEIYKQWCVQYEISNIIKNITSANENLLKIIVPFLEADTSRVNEDLNKNILTLLNKLEKQDGNILTLILPIINSTLKKTCCENEFYNNPHRTLSYDMNKETIIVINTFLKKFSAAFDENNLKLFLPLLEKLTVSLKKERLAKEFTDCKLTLQEAILNTYATLDTHVAMLVLPLITSIDSWNRNLYWFTQLNLFIKKTTTLDESISTSLLLHLFGVNDDLVAEIKNRNTNKFKNIALEIASIFLAILEKNSPCAHQEVPREDFYKILQLILDKYITSENFIAFIEILESIPLEKRPGNFLFVLHSTIKKYSVYDSKITERLLVLLGSMSSKFRVSIWHNSLDILPIKETLKYLNFKKTIDWTLDSILKALDDIDKQNRLSFIIFIVGKVLDEIEFNLENIFLLLEKLPEESKLEFLKFCTLKDLISIKNIECILKKLNLQNKLTFLQSKKEIIAIDTSKQSLAMEFLKFITEEKTVKWDEDIIVSILEDENFLEKSQFLQLLEKVVIQTIKWSEGGIVSLLKNESFLEKSQFLKLLGKVVIQTIEWRMKSIELISKKLNKEEQALFLNLREEKPFNSITYKETYYTEFDKTCGKKVAFYECVFINILQQFDPSNRVSFLSLLGNTINKMPVHVFQLCLQILLPKERKLFLKIAANAIILMRWNIKSILFTLELLKGFSPEIIKSDAFEFIQLLGVRTLIRLIRADVDNFCEVLKTLFFDEKLDLLLSIVNAKTISWNTSNILKVLNALHNDHNKQSKGLKLIIDYHGKNVTYLSSQTPINSVNVKNLTNQQEIKKIAAQVDDTCWDTEGQGFWQKKLPTLIGKIRFIIDNVFYTEDQLTEIEKHLQNHGSPWFGKRTEKVEHFYKKLKQDMDIFKIEQEQILQISQIIEKPVELCSYSNYYF